MQQKMKTTKLPNILFPLLLALYEVTTYLSMDAYLPALPRMAQDLHVSHYLMQLTLSCWFMGSASMLLFFGPLAERYGYRRVLLSGGLLFVLSTAGCFYVRDIYTLFFLRFLQGVASASLLTAGYAALHASYNRLQAASAIGVMNAITVLAPAFGPLCGSLLMLEFNYTWIFISLAVWAALALAGLSYKMPNNSNMNPERRINWSGIARQYGHIMRNPSFILYAFSQIFSFMAMITWITVTPFLLINYYGFSGIQFGLVQGLVFGAFMAAGFIMRHFIERYDWHRIIWVGFAVGVFGSALLLFAASAWPQHIWPLITGMTLISISSAIKNPLLSRLGIETSQQPMALRVALYMFITMLCGMLVSNMASSISVSSQLPLALFLAGCTGLALLSFMLQRLLYAKQQKTTACTEDLIIEGTS